MMSWLDLSWMRASMDTLDVGQLAFYCSAILVGITWAGIILLKPFFRWWVRRQPGSNDLVSYDPPPLKWSDLKYVFRH